MTAETSKRTDGGQMRHVVLRSGIMMYPRDPTQRKERVKWDHAVMVLPTRTPEGPGWSFLRGGPRREKWYVLGNDVCPQDFEDARTFLGLDSTK